MKKISTLLLALVASIGTIIASDTQVNGIWYDFNSSAKTATVTYRGPYYDYYSNEYSGSVSIPSSVTYNNVTYSVTSIGSTAFRDCSGLTSVTIPNSVTSIGNYAFYNCSGLTSITIPEGVTIIGNGAFYNCSGLTAVTIPNSVTSIRSDAFYNCSGLTSITIPEGVTSIGSDAFSGCSDIEVVSLGDAMQQIGARAFKDCQRIIDIYSYAQRVPDVVESTFEGVSRRAYLWVPANRKRNYWTHEIWGQFTVQVTGAEPTNAKEVSVVPAYNTATVIWPAVENANRYEIAITDKSNNTICDLVFNSEGFLQSIDFKAPIRRNAPAQVNSTGFSFEVTGLEEGTAYDYSIAVIDAMETTIQTFFGSFETLNISTDLENPSAGMNGTQKILRNGQILILRGDRTYTITGQEVK